MTILYPIASSAEEALTRPKGRAAREREAQALAGEAVRFSTEPAGPAYATREAALDAFSGRVEDDRPGRGASLPPEDRYCALVERAEGRALAPVRPAYRDGRRWPDPPPAPKTVWRLLVSYWRAGAGADLPAPQAREARRRSRQEVDPATLKAMARQPLAPVKPQQPLDIGLFERRLPEAPHIIVPDE